MATKRLNDVTASAATGKYIVLTDASTDNKILYEDLTQSILQHPITDFAFTNSVLPTSSYSLNAGLLDGYDSSQFRLTNSIVDANSVNGYIASQFYKTNSVVTNSLTSSYMSSGNINTSTLSNVYITNSTMVNPHLWGTYRISPVGGDFTQISDAFDWFATQSLNNRTDGIRLVLDAGHYPINKYCNVNYTFPIYLQGSGYNSTFLQATEGLSGSTSALKHNMFEVYSDIGFTKLTFCSGSYSGWSNLNKQYICVKGNSPYIQATDFVMDGGNKGFDMQTNGSFFLFNFIMSNINGRAIRFSASGIGGAIDCEVGNFENCNIGIDLVTGSGINVYLAGLRFMQQTDNQVGLNYTGSYFGYSNFTLMNCQTNGTGTGSHGFDFTTARDADIVFRNFVGQPSATPFAKVNVINSTGSTVANNVWVKARYATSSLYLSKFAYTTNSLVYLSSYQSDFICNINGNASIAAGGTNTLDYAIVKNGNTSSLYGETTVTIDTSGRKFTIGTNAYIPSLKRNDKLELYVKTNQGTGVIIDDLNWLTNIR